MFDLIIQLSRVVTLVVHPSIGTDWSHGGQYSWGFRNWWGGLLVVPYRLVQSLRSGYSLINILSARTLVKVHSVK